MAEPQDGTVTCPRDGCAYRAKDAERLTRHLRQFHDDEKRNERRLELMKRRNSPMEKAK